MADYAFVGPPAEINETYITILERLLRRRRAQVIGRTVGRETVNEFVNFLKQDTSGEVQRPIGDVHIGAHATIDGGVLLQAFRGQPRDMSDFETLAQTMLPPPPEPPNPSRSILIPPALVAPPVPPATARFVRFRGCNIGKLPDALLQWKKAFGNQLSVIAPKHFHGVHEVSDDLASKWGGWESMSYEFTVSSPTAVTGATAAARTAALRALYVERQAEVPARRLKFTDGTEVPNNRWAPWLQGLDVQTGGQSKMKPYRLKQPVAGKKTLSVPRRLMVQSPSFTANPHEYPTADDVPTSKPVRLAQLQLDLERDRRFQSSYGLTFPERAGFALEGASDQANVDAFISGHDWSFSVQRITKTGPVRTVFDLVATGTRVVYTLLIPISEANPGVTPNTSPLLVNFYPNAADFPAPARELPEVDGPHFKIV